MIQKLIKTSTDQSIQLYFIGDTLHVADHLIHQQVYTGLKFAGKSN